MNDVKWIKLTVNVFDDEKIKFIETMPNGDTLIIIWFKLLCLAGKCNSGGYIMLTDKLAYTDEMLSSIFRKDIKMIQFALNTFQMLDMVEIVENRYFISNWDKHQSLDKLEAKKAYDREYQKKVREAKKISLENRTSVVRVSNDNRSLELELDLDKESIKEEEPRACVLFDLFETEMQRPITQKECELLSEWLQEFPSDVLELSLTEAVKSNARNFRYIEAILNNWRQAGVKTHADALRQIAEFETAKKPKKKAKRTAEVPLPDWYTGKEAEEETVMSEEERQKLIEELKNFG
ncbi:phage replisome organizer N-terminal domain-containing protein [Dielma fastidiosa]|uniref:Putative phage replisome organizer n=1 Tax=Dielma fastidiosa TaxID=1034346 RepID=A0A318KNL8_9FIRM|nr:phage replisome organizer N-terminal domain-containing protein [Dielma fastidiosa]PXX77395.1 putative phage replisome organizer [Dielma fastidiosa]